MRDGWTDVTVEEIVQLVQGRYVAKDKYVEDGPYFIYGSNSVMGKYSHALIEPAHTVMAAIGAYAGSVRFSSAPSWVNNNAFGLVTKPSVEPKYFFYWLQNKLDLSKIVAGTGQPYVQRPSLMGTVLSLPSLVEQKRIVHLVSSVDSYIDSLQQQVDTARTARNAVLHELLTAGGDDWVETTLGETLEIARGGSPRPIRDFITSESDGINWVKIGDASASSKYIYKTEQKIRRDGISKSRVVKPGDFILSNSMSFGRPYIMKTEGCIHDGWLLFSGVNNHFNEDFLYNLLMSDAVQRQFESLAAGSGVRNLNIDVAKEVKILLPPILVQNEIAAVANSFDETVLCLERALAYSKNLRSGLLSDLLSGNHAIPESYDEIMGAA